MPRMCHILQPFLAEDFPRSFSPTKVPMPNGDGDGGGSENEHDGYDRGKGKGDEYHHNWKLASQIHFDLCGFGHATIKFV